MGESNEINILSVLLIGMLGMFMLAFGVVMFFIIYQRRLLAQRRKLQDAEIKHQRNMLAATIQSQEVERDRIARDLHDELGSLLSTVRLYFNQVNKNNFDEVIPKVEPIMEEMTDNIRRIAQDMKPIVLENLGLKEALYDLIGKINSAGEIKAKIACPDLPLLGNENELALFRVVQELINNTLKHAKASLLSLNLSLTKTHIIMVYTDNGVGFNYDSSLQGGLGLKNIESRLSLMDGVFNVDDQVDEGVKFIIRIPINS